MKRRTALRLAAGSLAGLAGCVSAGYDPPASGDTDTTTPATSPSPTATRSSTATTTGTPTAVETSTATSTSEAPRIVDRAFRVTGRECGTGEGGAHLTLDAPRVVVEGTAVGSNGCETARLESATYDSDSDTLTVVVGVYQPDDTAACTQCLIDVDYRLSVRFEGGTPGSVRVVHENAVVEESSVG